MTTLDALLAGIVAEPLEETRWLVLADYLEEHDDPRRAELLRLHRRLLATCCVSDSHTERTEPADTRSAGHTASRTPSRSGVIGRAVTLPGKMFHRQQACSTSFRSIFTPRVQTAA
jgi:uncharacterized protein (TIGR02996 family)